MSGIIGKLSFERDERLARSVLERMLDAVTDRTSTTSPSGIAAAGGAERELHNAPGIALGGARVAAASSTRVVADSRLTNRKELLAELRRAGYQVGHQLPDLSDAHLIAHAYEAWGERCFARFDGTFACAVWDQRHRRLLLARDHIGITPLYFAVLHGHGVVFASELKALFHDPGVTRDYCPEAIDAYLTLGYVPAPLTAFRRISKVEPAQFVVIDGRRLHTESYWDVPATSSRVSAEAATEQLAAQLRMATRDAGGEDAHAVLFSGGIASSALLWATPDDTTPVITVALDQDTSDLAHSDAAARQFGRTPIMELASIETSAVAADLAARFDEPIADPSAVAHYATYVAARPHADSAISGLGAAALLDGAPRHTVWDGDDRRGIYTRAFAWEVRSANPRSRYQELCETRTAADPFARSSYVQLRSVLAESALMIANRTSLAAGLTLHLPYLDRRFVEFAATIPSAAKREGHGPIPLLRALLSGRVAPEAIPAARAASRVPQWLQRSLPAMVPSVLLAPRFDGRGIVSRPALRLLWDEHCRGRHDHSLHFWSLLMLEYWFREYIDGDASEQPLEYAVLKAA